jgi:hypothetical protein
MHQRTLGQITTTKVMVTVMVIMVIITITLVITTTLGMIIMDTITTVTEWAAAARVVAKRTIRESTRKKSTFPFFEMTKERVKSDIVNPYRFLLK